MGLHHYFFLSCQDLGGFYIQQRITGCYIPPLNLSLHSYPTPEVGRWRGGGGFSERYQTTYPISLQDLP